MKDIEISRDQVPLWKGADGKLNIKTSLAGDGPLTPGQNPVLDTSWAMQGGNDFAFTGDGTLRLGMSSTTTVRIVPIWKNQFAAAADLVERFELQPALTDDNVLLACQFGALGSVTAEGSFRYSVLSASASLTAGGDASYLYIRPFARSTRFVPMVTEAFRAMRLPAQVTAPPAPGEAIAFEYGGYLGFGASVSAGYSIKGTRDLGIRDLKLSEHYRLGVVGSLGVKGKIAGHFAVEVRSGSDPDWVRLTVRRSRSKEAGVAADLKVNASLRSEGMPRSGQEFLGALLGVSSKNWLNLIDSVAEEGSGITNLQTLANRLDTLGMSFFDRYAGKALDRLVGGEVAGVLAQLNQVVASYRSLDDSAIALFDRYFDPVMNQVDEMCAHLDSLAALASWDRLKGEVNPTLWNIVQQLTDGDPLGWILGRAIGPDATFAAFKKRIQQARDLARDQAHEEIRNLIKLAKTEFGLDRLFNILDAVDSSEDLKRTASSAVRGLVERLTGQAVDALDGRSLKRVFEIVKEVAARRAEFLNYFDQRLQDAANQKFTLAVAGAYRSASERTALIDVEIRLRKDGAEWAPGIELMRAAVHGDFEPLLSRFQPEAVRIRKGVLTGKLSEESCLKINIVGWHRNFEYSSLWRAVTQSSQQIRTTPAGGITVFTQVDMSVGSERRRKSTKSEEKMHTNFTLRYLGETRGVIDDSKFDEDDRRYLIEVITSQSADYQSTFTDANTSREELAEYFAFARALGLDKCGATAETVLPLMQGSGDDLGAVSGEYSVRFSEEGLKRLFSTATSDAQIRTLLRRIVVANCIGKGNIAAVAALYASDKVRALYDASGPNFIDTQSVLGEALQAGTIVTENVIPGVKFPPVSNDVSTRMLVAGLLDVERDLLRGFTALRELLTSGAPVHLDRFESRLQHFANALNRFDQADLGDNTVFAVIDGLIALSAPAPEPRSSVMSFECTGTDGKKKNLLFTNLAAVPSP